MEFYCQKVNGVLIGADEPSKEALASIGTDTLVTCKTSKKRNLLNHRRFFAFIETAFHKQDHFTDQEEFRKWLTMKSGYYTTIVAPNGNTIFLPQSIAFASELDEEGFRQLFDKCVSTFIAEFNVNMTSNDFWEIASFS